MEKEITNNKPIQNVSVLEDYLTYYEGLAVLCFWKKPELFKDYDGEIRFNKFLNDEINPENNLLHSSKWRMIFDVGEDLVLVEKATRLDRATINNYLLRHKKVAKKFAELSPHFVDDLIDLYEPMVVENLPSYLAGIKKYKSLLKLQESFKFQIDPKTISHFESFTENQIYDRYENLLQQAFITKEEGIESFHLFDGVDENIQKWAEGFAQGVALYNLPHYSAFLGGIQQGGITLIGGVSNVGKSSFLRNVIIPGLVMQGEDIFEKTVVFLNEEDLDKWQRELITWTANNRLCVTNRFTKNELRNGVFSEETSEGRNCKSVLYESIQEGKKIFEGKNDLIFIPLPKFSTDIVLKQMKRYSADGYTNFIIDTFKMDNTDDARVDDNTRLQLIQNMTKIYNLCKPTVKNLRVICTVQLSKAASYKRNLSQEDLAESKNIIDVCSTGIFMRPVWQDEKNEKIEGRGGGIPNPHYLKVRDFSGKTWEDGQIQQLNEYDKYLLLFTVKNREGEAGVGTRAFVIRVDWAKNTIEEIGTTIVPIDSGN